MTERTDFKTFIVGDRVRCVDSAACANQHAHIRYGATYFVESVREDGFLRVGAGQYPSDPAHFELARPAGGYKAGDQVLFVDERGIVEDERVYTVKEEQGDFRTADLILLAETPGPYRSRLFRFVSRPALQGEEAK